MADDDHDYGELLVLQHHGATGPAELEEMLDGRTKRRPYRVIQLGAGEPVPELTDPVRGVLVLGGPMSVLERDSYPWMEPELSLLSEAVESEVPVFGICLGAQLLATALGGEVSRRDEPEAAYVELSRTAGADDDEIFAGWPDGSPQLLLHEDEVGRLPDGAVAMLEGSEGTPAWRASQPGCYGVQTHPEVGPAELRAWLGEPDFAEFFEHPAVDIEDLLDEAERRELWLRAVGVSLVGRWVDEVVGADDPVPRVPKEEKDARKDRLWRVST